MRHFVNVNISIEVKLNSTDRSARSHPYYDIKTTFYHSAWKILRINQPSMDLNFKGVHVVFCLCGAIAAFDNSVHV